MHRNCPALAPSPLRAAPGPGRSPTSSSRWASILWPPERLAKTSPPRLPCPMAPRVDWPALPYGEWRATRDTLHAHTQVLGKLSVALAPPEPELQHAALRLTARGWETGPLPAPDGSGALVAALDLRRHEAVAEHTTRGERRIPLTPDRPVGEVTRELLAAPGELGGEVRIDPTPQAVEWSVP